MGFGLYIAWPLEGPVPTCKEADVIYHRLNEIWLAKGIAKWMGNCLEGMQYEAVDRLQLRPYSFAHWYEEFEEGGFPTDSDSWFGPDEMVEATEKLQRLIDEEDPDALVLVECYIQHNRTGQGEMPAYGEPIPRVLEGEDPVEVEKWRADTLQELLRNLDGVIATAQACKKEGIERIAFCIF